jgi:hypothetical protein
MTTPQPSKTYNIPMDMTMTIESMQCWVPRSRSRLIKRYTPPAPTVPQPKEPWTGPRQVGLSTSNFGYLSRNRWSSA